MWLLSLSCAAMRETMPASVAVEPSVCADSAGGAAASAAHADPERELVRRDCAWDDSWVGAGPMLDDAFFSAVEALMGDVAGHGRATCPVARAGWRDT